MRSWTCGETPSFLVTNPGNLQPSSQLIFFFLSPHLSTVPGNLGCFRDSGDPPTLSGTSETSNKLTIQNCISFCRQQRYKVRVQRSRWLLAAEGASGLTLVSRREATRVAPCRVRPSSGTSIIAVTRRLPAITNREASPWQSRLTAGNERLLACWAPPRLNVLLISPSDVSLSRT